MLSLDFIEQKSIYVEDYRNILYILLDICHIFLYLHYNKDKDMKRIKILESHGIRAIQLESGIIIADTSEQENGTCYNVSSMTDKEFYQFLGY